jgi:hypothetical protein
MRAAVDSPYSDCIFVFPYNDFVQNPQHAMNRLHAFIHLDRYSYDFENIEAPFTENDVAAFGIEGLHKVERCIPKTSTRARDVLGTRLYDFYKEYTI